MSLSNKTSMTGASDPKHVVRTFIDTINRGDADGLARLMTEDHIFVDAVGKIDSGRENMRKGWQWYFDTFPDYRITVEDIAADGNFVAVFGSTFGTYNGKRGLVPENRIEMPTAWRAVVEGDRVKRWQVYADWTRGWEIIREDEVSDTKS